MMNLSTTELTNELTKDLDTLTSSEIVKLINDEDKKVAAAVEACLPKIAFAVDLIVNNFLKGGRLFYFGAGTSGRLGVLDASECPPTFGVSKDMVVGIIAGGDSALRNAIEGAEDNETLAENDFRKYNITDEDTVVVISASGNAKYILKILECAQNKGIKTVAITSNSKAKSEELADIFICPETGAEVLAGSTRMKAGTAQKMILNMLTTASMVKIGKVYDNLMIDLAPTNTKLKSRAVRIVADIAETDERTALKVLKENGFKVKQAILNIKYDLSYDVATELLNRNHQQLKASIRVIEGLQL